MKPQERHFAFCVNDAYAAYIAVTIKSIAENNRGGSNRIYVFTDAMSERSRKTLADVVGPYENCSLHIYEVDDTPLRGLYAGNFTIYTWYRILIPSILPESVERVLYLDADTLVTDSLDGLFSMDMTDKAIAAAPDIQSWFENAFRRCGYDKSKGYVCAGVLMMNLDYWRRHDLTEKMRTWALQKQDLIKCPDQDAINYICQDAKIVLPLRYGFMHCFCEYDMFYEAPYREELKACIGRPAIIHYNGCAPWAKENHKHVMHHVWEQYNRMLRRPVRRRYTTMGMLKFKTMIWDLVHLYKGRQASTEAAVRARLENKG